MLDAVHTIHMSGLIASVLLRQSFTPADTGRVSNILRSVVDGVSETRKCRHWEFVVQNATASLSVQSTFEHAHDFEDQLISNDLLFDDAPDAFVLCFVTRRDSDIATCAKLAALLAESFGGIDCSFDGNANNPR